MSPLVEKVQKLIRSGKVRISEHGYEELAADGLTATEVVHGAGDVVVVEEYPDYPKGPCILLLQRDAVGNPVHAVWGIPKGQSDPVVLVTAYRPNPDRWLEDFTGRRDS